MINPMLTIQDWGNISVECNVPTLQFEPNLLAESISKEFSFEAEASTGVIAYIAKLFIKIKDFIVSKIRAAGDYIQSKRFKNISDRANTFVRYMNIKMNKQATSDIATSARRLLGGDPEYAKGFESALSSLNNHLADPFENPDEFISEIQGAVGSPLSIAHVVAKRSKVKTAPPVKLLGELIEAINKFLIDPKNYRWEAFGMDDDKVQGLDVIRFILGDHSLQHSAIEEYDHTAQLVRGLFTDNKIVEASENIYNPEKNTQYVLGLSAKLPKTVQSLREAERNLKRAQQDFKQHTQSMPDDMKEFNGDILKRMQAFISMVGALSGYLGNVNNIVNQIDGYNASLMFVLKYVNPDVLAKHIKDRGMFGTGKTELDTQAYTLLMNDAGEIQMALEHYGLESVEQEMQTLSDNYVKASAIYSRVQAYGASIKDGASLESMSPNCFKGQAISDLFEFRPSMKNAEIALEVSGALKTAFLSSLVALVIKYMDKIIEFTKQRLSAQRIKRAMETISRFRVSITKKVPADRINGQDVMEGIQKRRGLDSQGEANPSGHSHNSVNKPKPMDIEAPSARMALYKNVLVPVFGVDDNSGAGLVSCTDVKDFLRFLNSTNVKGPAIFSNDPISNTRRLVVLANTSVTELRNSIQGMAAVKRQLDGFIAGTEHNPHFINEAAGPMKIFLEDHGDDNIGRLAKTVREQLNVWDRRVSLVGSPIFKDPAVIDNVFKMLSGFKDQEMINYLHQFKKEIKGLTDSAQLSLDKFMNVESDPEKKEKVRAAVQKYVGELRELGEMLGVTVNLVVKSMGYIESLANAANIFIEGK